MNRERAKELLPIIEAYANGAMVQFRVRGESDWSDGTVNVGFHQTHYEYRIKPEPHDIKWAAQQFGKKCRRRLWRAGVYWDGVRLRSSANGCLNTPLMRDDILADDWEIYEPGDGK